MIRWMRIRFIAGLYFLLNIRVEVIVQIMIVGIRKSRDVVD